jgi:murein peptide amidase A
MSARAAGVLATLALALIIVASAPGSSASSGTGIGQTVGRTARSVMARNEVQRKIVFGRSVEGRRLVATELGDPSSSRKVLVVGVIHGDERAGLAITHDLVRRGPPSGLDLWVVHLANPDGAARGTRQNAHRVDLNRNFPWRWRLQGKPGSHSYSGPRVLSEPESRAMRKLILRIHPRLTVWYHQALTLVDQSGGDVDLERSYARRVGLPLVKLSRFHGSITSWENQELPGATAFVVELAGGDLSPAAARRHASAYLHIARVAPAP